MKKILTLFIFLGLCSGFAMAEETETGVNPDTVEQQEIMLDTNNTQQMQYELSGSKYRQNLGVNNVNLQQEVTDYSKTNPNEKRSATVGGKKKVKDVSFGTKSTFTTTSDSCTESNTIYTEYEKKKFKLNSGYTTNVKQNQENSDKGSLFVAPEYKFNKHVSIQNQNSANLNDNSKKTELRLNVQPMKDDRMNMGVGVGQKFSGSSAPSSSQVNFSTNFKF